ncbi:hypothetical protein [Falsiroseomonas sp. E2-1-a20]|uniref:hypothetical protein n=1 Tax=Falsiroseomonas sp. E2-1-a20 TaxID=3239300 RepID=UPI003F3D4CAD
MAARIEASGMGLEIRFVVTSFGRGSDEWVYDGMYCARGTGREPGEAARGPARLRPHLLPPAFGQPAPPGAAHCRLMADADADAA